MVDFIKRKKAMSVSPLKASQPVGASLAFLGMNRAMPMMHGSQGCTAFGKVFFVRHFREPIPLQTTAMDQVSAVMGSEPSIVEGLKTLCEKSKPALIGLPTTGLSETQGSDINRAVHEFRAACPQFDAIKVVPVNTPDYCGSLESGYAAAVLAMINVVVPPADTAGTQPGRRKRQVNVLAASLLTPGDIETLKDIIESFGLRPVVIPDLSGSLDGHLGDQEFTPLTTGGTDVSELESAGDAVATLVVGASLNKAADLLKERTGVPDYRFASLMGLEAMDELIVALKAISGRSVPEKIERQRARLQDAMLDTHFMLGFARFALAADPDLLYAFSHLLAGMGAEVVAAVVPERSAVLGKAAVSEIKIGDLEDMEIIARERGADVVIGNSHAVDSAQRLGMPILRAGFPQYDLVGGFQRAWIGYAGTTQVLFDLANILLLHNQHEIEPYHSIYAQKPEAGLKGVVHEH